MQRNPTLGCEGLPHVITFSLLRIILVIPFNLPRGILSMSYRAKQFIVQSIVPIFLRSYQNSLMQRKPTLGREGLPHVITFTLLRSILVIPFNLPRSLPYVIPSGATLLRSRAYLCIIFYHTYEFFLFTHYFFRDIFHSLRAL